MFNLISHDFPKSLLGQTALMFIVLALVLAVLWAFISHHYFMGAEQSDSTPRDRLVGLSATQVQERI
jgi:hypothetical protein